MLPPTNDTTQFRAHFVSLTSSLLQAISTQQSQLVSWLGVTFLLYQRFFILSSRFVRNSWFSRCCQSRSQSHASISSLSIGSHFDMTYLRCAYLWIEPFSALELWSALESCTVAPLLKSQEALEQMDSVPVMSLESVWSQWPLEQVITFPNHSFPFIVLKIFRQ